MEALVHICQNFNNFKTERTHIPLSGVKAAKLKDTCKSLQWSARVSQKGYHAGCVTATEGRHRLQGDLFRGFLVLIDILIILQPLDEIINLGLVYPMMFLPALPRMMWMLEKHYSVNQETPISKLMISTLTIRANA